MIERDGESKLTFAAALGMYAYAALTLGLPFVADMGIPFGVFCVLWLGGSVVAGALIPRRWMFAVPVVTLVILLFVMFQGYADTEFLSDPLSSVALFVLTCGELLGLAAGYATVGVVRARRSA